MRASVVNCAFPFFPAAQVLFEGFAAERVAMSPRQAFTEGAEMSVKKLTYAADRRTQSISAHTIRGKCFRRLPYGEPFGNLCFVEFPRELAREAQVGVTMVISAACPSASHVEKSFCLSRENRPARAGMIDPGPSDPWNGDPELLAYHFLTFDQRLSLGALLVEHHGQLTPGSSSTNPT